MNDSLKKDFDLGKIQCGYWFVIHKWPISTKSREERIAYCAFISFTAEEFICAECRGHVADFVKNDPPIQYIDSAENMFFWSWKLHNSATEHANLKRKPENRKQPMPFEEAKNMWTSDIPCDSCAITSIQEFKSIQSNESNESNQEIKPYKLTQINNLNQYSNRKASQIIKPEPVIPVKLLLRDDEFTEQIISRRNNRPGRVFLNPANRKKY